MRNLNGFGKRVGFILIKTQKSLGYAHILQEIIAKFRKIAARTRKCSVSQKVFCQRR